MKTFQSFVVCLIITVALALTFVSAFAKSDNFHVTSRSWTTYIEDNGIYHSSSFTGRADITIHSGKVILEINGDRLYLTINSSQVDEDNGKGVYLYCNDGYVINLYVDKFSETKLLISQKNTTVIFDL